MKLAFAFIVEEDDLVSKRLRHLKCRHGSNDRERDMMPTISKAKGEVITKVAMVVMEEEVVMEVIMEEEMGVIEIEEFKAQDGREIKSIIEQVIFFAKKINKRI